MDSTEIFTRGTLACYPVGRAGQVILACPAGAVPREAAAIAENLAEIVGPRGVPAPRPDAVPLIVVADLGTDYPAASWEPVALTLRERLAGGYDHIGLVSCTPSAIYAIAAGQWLADRLGCTVLAQDGPAVLAARGTLFVPAGAGSGWLRLRPGQPPQDGWRCFPPPPRALLPLETLAGRPAVLGAGAVTEPLPGGAWIRPAAGIAPGLEAHHRRRLHGRLAGEPDQFTVVLGCPGGPPLPLSAVNRFWELVPPGSRPAVRFAPYGPVRAPAQLPLGQLLADLLSDSVVTAAGLPVGGWRAADTVLVETVSDDGAAGWQPFAHWLGYTPRALTRGRTRPPLILGHRPPMAGLPELSRGVYACGTDAVIEIIQSGLWLRPAEEPPGAARIRGRAADPRHGAIVFGPVGDQDRAYLYAQVARELLERFEPRVRGGYVVLPGAPGAAPVVTDISVVRRDDLRLQAGWRRRRVPQPALTMPQAAG